MNSLGQKKAIQSIDGIWLGGYGSREVSENDNAVLMGKELEKLFVKVTMFVPNILIWYLKTS